MCPLRPRPDGARRPTARVFVGLGSNVGDRWRFLCRALQKLKQIPSTSWVGASPVFETSPVGPRQRHFLNAVAELRSSLFPEELLAYLKGIESALGRRKRRRWGPREIDLDLLFVGRLRRNGALRLPHPRWKKRKFVLWPLAALAPRFRDVVSGRSVAYFRRKLTDSDQTITLYPRSLP